MVPFSFINNKQGLAGLSDASRSGAPTRYTGEVRAQIIATALTNPQELKQPFGSWTYQRLNTYLREIGGFQMKQTRMFEVLQTEGLRWRKQETWFGERVDPDFAEKRGPLNSCGESLLLTAPSWISMKWDPSRPRAIPGKRRSK